MDGLLKLKCEQCFCGQHNLLVASERTPSASGARTSERTNCCAFTSARQSPNQRSEGAAAARHHCRPFSFALLSAGN
jgi:hypothetical protein